MDPQVRELFDRAAISRVVHEYCRTLDMMDIERLTQLFSEDCVVIFGPAHESQFTGHDHLHAAIQRMWRWRRTSHHVSNLQIQFKSSDSATSTSAVLAWHEDSVGNEAIFYGEYQDEFLRMRGEWLISKRRVVEKGCNSSYTNAVIPFPRLPPPDDWELR